MNRIYLSIVVLSGLFITSSFQATKNPAITGKWQATLIDIPSQDSIMHVQMKAQNEQVEGLTEVDSNMIERFGTNDLATIKKMAKEEIAKQPEQTKAEMKKRTEEISMELMSDGKAISSFGGEPEPLKWYFADDGKKLFLDPFEQKATSDKSPGQVMIFDIVTVTSNTMRLLVNQQAGQDAFLNFSKVKSIDVKK